MCISGSFPFRVMGCSSRCTDILRCTLSRMLGPIPLDRSKQTECGIYSREQTTESTQQPIPKQTRQTNKTRHTVGHQQLTKESSIPHPVNHLQIRTLNPIVHSTICIRMPTMQAPSHLCFLPISLAACCPHPLVCFPSSG